MSTKLMLKDLEQVIHLPGGIPLEIAAKPLTVRLALIHCIGMIRAENGVAAIRAYDLGSVLLKSGESCGVSADDLVFLKNAVEQNGVGFVAFVQGFLLKYLGQTEGSMDSRD